MRIIIVLAAIITGCATKPQPIALNELTQIVVKDKDCKNIAASINWLEQQARLAQIPVNANPEQLTPYQREYNANIRIRVWALRIGCNNPERYRASI